MKDTYGLLKAEVEALNEVETFSPKTRTAPIATTAIKATNTPYSTREAAI